MVSCLGCRYSTTREASSRAPSAASAAEITPLLPVNVMSEQVARASTTVGRWREFNWGMDWKNDEGGNPSTTVWE